MSAGAALVAAESMLALTPVVIKKTPLDPVSAILSRVVTSSALGYLITGDRSLPKSEWTGAASLGYLNLLHIASSYESFRNLPAGQAMSLLYTYPLWNLILNALINNEPVTGKDYGFMALASIGAILLNTDPGTAATTALGRKPRYGWGVLMGIVMALTESGMNVVLRHYKWMDAAKSVWVVNGSATAWLTAALAGQAVLGGDAEGFQVTGTWMDALLLTGFNALTLFSGYWLRFFAVPRLSVVTYAILSYAGLLASYLFGLIFLGEKPGWLSIMGAGLILVSGVFLQVFKTSDESKATEQK